MTARRPALAELPAWPLLLSAELAAAYLGLSPNTFRAGVGTLWPEPARIGARRLWDRRALDAAAARLPTAGPSAAIGPLDGGRALAQASDPFHAALAAVEHAGSSGETH